MTLGQYRCKLVQQLLLAHAGALRKLGKHILAERRTELSGRNRLIRPWPTQELTCGATPPALSLPMRSVRPPRMLPAGAFVGTGSAGAGGARPDRAPARSSPPNILPRSERHRDRDRGREIAAGHCVLHCIVKRSHRRLLRVNSKLKMPLLNHKLSAAFRRSDDRDYWLAFSPSIPHIGAWVGGAREGMTCGLESPGSFLV